MRKVLFVMVIAMVVVGLLTAIGLAATKMMMDGSKWKLEMKMMPMKASAKPMSDMVMFDKGMFDSSACHQYGMYKGKYMEKMKGKEMMWSAKVKGTKGTNSYWQGTITGDKMKGTVTYSGKMKAKMQFSGMKMKPAMMAEKKKGMM